MNLLYHWAAFHRMDYLEKRDLFNDLIAEKFDLKCEAHVYRVLTRLTFQSLRRKYGEQYAFTGDDERFDTLLQELGLSPSTVVNWYHSTLKKKPLRVNRGACGEFPTGLICECVSDKVLQRVEKDYDFRLASKRLYQTIVKAELFKARLSKGGLEIADGSLRVYLRRIVEKDYYRKHLKLGETEALVQGVLEEASVKAMTVLKWFSLIKHHPELLKKVGEQELSPDEMFEQSGKILRSELRGGGYAERYVCE